MQKQKQDRAITLRRDGKNALKFKAERIGAASRHYQYQDDNDDWYTLEVSARLYKTTGGNNVVGVEGYDKTNEQDQTRFAEAASSLKELVELLKGPQGPNVDNDLLGELFEDTEIADQFVEQID